MNCSICHKITNLMNCGLCNEPCCTKCLSLHMVRFHNNGNLQKMGNFIQPKLPKPDSPYITEGYLSKTIIYDPKFDLKNFSSVTVNGQKKILGEGSLAKVYLAMNSIDKKLYAIKYMKKESVINTTYATTGFRREVEYQSKIHHPNIVALLNVQATQHSLYFIMEYGDAGSLFSYIKKRGYLREDQAFKFFIQTANAIYFLHSHNFIHRDLKPENILLFKEDTLKICDFGWCCNLDEFNGARSTFCGTMEYMSPEIVNKQKYTKEIDIWSLGVLFYEMLHGFSPFSDPYFGDYGIAQKIKMHQINFSPIIGPECRELILRMLDPNPLTRIKIEEIFSTKLVKKYEKIGFAFPPKYTYNLNSNFPNAKEKETIDQILYPNNPNYAPRNIKQNAQYNKIPVQTAVVKHNRTPDKIRTNNNEYKIKMPEEKVHYYVVKTQENKHTNNANLNQEITHAQVSKIAIKHHASNEDNKNAAKITTQNKRVIKPLKENKTTPDLLSKGIQQPLGTHDINSSNADKAGFSTVVVNKNTTYTANTTKTAKTPNSNYQNSNNTYSVPKNETFKYEAKITHINTAHDEKEIIESNAIHEAKPKCPYKCIKPTFINTQPNKKNVSLSTDISSQTRNLNHSKDIVRVKNVTTDGNQNSSKVVVNEKNQNEKKSANNQVTYAKDSKKYKILQKYDAPEKSATQKQTTTTTSNQNTKKVTKIVVANSNRNSIIYDSNKQMVIA